MAAQAWEGFVLLNDLKGVTVAAEASPKDVSLNPLVPILHLGLPLLSLVVPPSHSLCPVPHLLHGPIS